MGHHLGRQSAFGYERHCSDHFPSHRACLQFALHVGEGVWLRRKLGHILFLAVAPTRARCGAVALKEGAALRNHPVALRS